MNTPLKSSVQYFKHIRSHLPSCRTAVYFFPGGFCPSSFSERPSEVSQCSRIHLGHHLCLYGDTLWILLSKLAAAALGCPRSLHPDLLFARTASWGAPPGHQMLPQPQSLQSNVVSPLHYCSWPWAVAFCSSAPLSGPQFCSWAVGFSAPLLFPGIPTVQVLLPGSKGMASLLCAVLFQGPAADSLELPRVSASLALHTAFSSLDADKWLEWLGGNVLLWPRTYISLWP